MDLAWSCPAKIAVPGEAMTETTETPALVLAGGAGVPSSSWARAGSQTVSVHSPGPHWHSITPGSRGQSSPGVDGVIPGARSGP